MFLYSSFLIGLLFFTMSAPPILFGWKIAPVIHTINPECNQSTFNIISDKNEQEATIEIGIHNREIDIEGNETIEKTKDFFVYPSHMIIKPGQTRLVRVIWKGDKNIKEEKAYRLIAESLPIKIPFESTEGVEDVRIGINLGVRHVCSLYVTPKTTKPNIKCISAVVESREDKLFLIAEFENQGNEHGLLSSNSLEVTNGENMIKFTNDEIEKITDGRYNVLAHHKRIVQFPLPSTFKKGNPINVRLIEN